MLRTDLPHPLPFPIDAGHLPGILAFFLNDRDTIIVAADADGTIREVNDTLRDWFAPGRIDGRILADLFSPALIEAPDGDPPGS